MLGVDVVDIERLRKQLRSQPGLRDRLFTPAEIRYCDSKSDPVVHLAGTLAAKEAVIKALDLGPLVAWSRRLEMTRRATGAPQMSVEDRESRETALSITHEAGIAIAVASATGS